MKNKNGPYFLKNYWILATLFISLFPLFPLFHSGIFAGHDAPDHVARIANFYQNLTEGTLIPRWAGKLNWGYGHPILMFLYPLPSYVAALFIGIGFSVVAATKIVFALGFVLSGLTMFFWIKKIWDVRAAFVAATFYLFAPYRFVDLYVRGAIGENFFFIFPPLTCYFLLKLFETKSTRYIAWSALSLSGMILSHNALAIMFLPFISAYALILIFQGKNKVQGAFYSIISVILGFGLSAFFLIPAFLEGKYTLRDIVTKNEIFTRFETFARLIHSPWTHGGSGQLSVEIGVAQWVVIIGVFVVIFIYLFNRKFYKKLSVLMSDTSSISLTILAITFFIVSIIFILPISKPIYMLVSVLQKFQFPWRFLSLSVFTSAILAGFITVIITRKNSMAILMAMFSLALTIPFWQPDGFVEKPESFYTSTYNGTTDTGESAPIWSVRFMEKAATASAEIVEGAGRIEVGPRTSTKHVYYVETTSERARMVENTLYFPGWKVYVDNAEVPFRELLFQDPNYRGIINFYIDSPGEHKIVVKFTETKLRLLSNSISALSFILVVALLIYGKK